MIATEALAYNPLISAYRRRTLELRTEWETAHILRRENLQRAYRWVDTVDLKLIHPAARAAAFGGHGTVPLPCHSTAGHRGITMRARRALLDA